MSDAPAWATARNRSPQQLAFCATGRRLAAMRGKLPSLPARSMALALVLCCAACATPPTDPDALVAYHEANDPLESANRVIFERNRFMDRHILRPVAEAYVGTVPAGVRHGVHNVLTNLDKPLVTVNLALQCNFDDA